MTELLADVPGWLAAEAQGNEPPDFLIWYARQAVGG